MFERLRRQFFGAVRHALAQVLRAGFIGLLLGLLLGEVTGGLIDGPWPSHVFVHVAAIAFGLALGYAAAMTVAFFEGVRGLISAATELEGEVEGALRSSFDVGSQRFTEVVDAIEHRPSQSGGSALP